MPLMRVLVHFSCRLRHLYLGAYKKELKLSSYNENRDLDQESKQRCPKSYQMLQSMIPALTRISCVPFKTFSACLPLQMSLIP